MSFFLYISPMMVLGLYIWLFITDARTYGLELYLISMMNVMYKRSWHVDVAQWNLYV